MQHDIKQPKGIDYKGHSFNEYFVAKKTLPEWLEHARKAFDAKPSTETTHAREQAKFLPRDKKQWDAIFTEIYNKAVEAVKVQGGGEIAEAPKAEPKPVKAEK